MHIDDLVNVSSQPNSFILSQHHPQSRNFALNPKEGIKISPFKAAHTPEGQADRELEKLTRYLLHVANVEDFRTLSHKVRLTLMQCAVATNTDEQH